MSNHCYSEGLTALKKGQLLIDNRKPEEALSYFDFAIKSGIQEAYEDRAWCLESLRYDYEAIEDFNKAIKLKPDDCNLYYGRALAKHGCLDYEGAVLDLELAYTFSKFNTEENKWRNKKAIEMGYSSIHYLYFTHLESFKIDLAEYLNRLREIEDRKQKGLSTETLETINKLSIRSKKR